MTHIPDSTPAARLLDRLLAGEGYVIERGTEWCLYVRRNDYARPVDRVLSAAVKELVAKGHLVPRKGGGLEPLRQRMARSGNFGDQRPPQASDIRMPEINAAESPLAWLRARKDKAGRALISAEQFMAGEKLRADYERGCLGARVTANWDMSATAGRPGRNVIADVSDGALSAREALQRALDVVGPELASILVQVCCLSAGIEQAERILELPQRSGKAVLGLALTALARHYGFLKQAKRKSALGHWGTPDYRPAIPSSDEA